MLQRIKKHIKSSWLYYTYNERKITRSERSRFLREARLRFASEQATQGSVAEYEYCLRKYRVTYSEYMHQYKFWRLADAERAEYVSVSEMQRFYRRMVKPEIRRLMHNKQHFLRAYSNYIHREWLYTPDCSDAQVKDLIARHKVIAKPTDGSRGDGIFFIERGVLPDDATLREWKARKMLLEECISGHPAIEAFNPDSLNTIRVFTFRSGEKVLIYTAAIRFGRKGHHVDNAHAGGIRALIDPQTGIVDEGVDTDGNRYAVHPDSGLQIKGFVIPEWKKITDTCRQACLQTEDLIVCGWDVCVRHDGQIELIEGNHAPDIDGVQFSKQAGIRAELNAIFSDFYNTTL